MGILDVIKNIGAYGIDQPVTRRHPELQELLDNGSFIVDVVELLDAELKYRRPNAPKPDDYPDDSSVWIGFWDESTHQGLVDFYEKLYPLFYEYLGWDCTQKREASLAMGFMEQCVVPVISDYYQQTGYGCVIMVRNQQHKAFTGGIFLVWTYPQF